MLSSNSVATGKVSLFANMALKHVVIGEHARKSIYYTNIILIIQFRNNVKNYVIELYHTNKNYIIFSGGGTGFIGSQLIKSLSLEGVTCTCISRMPGPNRISWVDENDLIC